MTAPRRVAITGAGGQLGRQLVAAFRQEGGEVLELSHPEFEITRPVDLTAMVDWGPDLVVNAAAWTDVDGCARDPELAMRINGDGAGAVAAAAARAGATIVQISTNEVFDGTLDRPYQETDTPNPINPYGASKLAGERAVAASNPRYLIVRTAWLFGPGGTNFVTKILAAADRAVEQKTPLRVVDDEWGNPTWTPDLARAVVRHAGVGQPEIIHIAGTPPVSRFGWAEVVVGAASIDVALLPIARAAFVRESSSPLRAILGGGRDAVDDPLGWRGPTQQYVRAIRSGAA